MTGVGPLPKLTFLEVESYVVVVGWWLNCNLNCENQKSHGHELSKKKKTPFYHHHHLDSYVSTWSGANCGSLFLDLRFRELVKVGTIDVSVIYLCSLCWRLTRLFWPTTNLRYISLFIPSQTPSLSLLNPNSQSQSRSRPSRRYEQWFSCCLRCSIDFN